MDSLTAGGKSCIAIHVAREHNLKNISLEIPRDQLIVRPEWFRQISTLARDVLLPALTENRQRLITSAPTLFLFYDPTTGLHFDDVRVLLQVFQRLVDAGHSVLVIEHNLDVIKCADWVIDLGPEAGDRGGQIVATGTPEAVAANPTSHTGQHLKTVLGTTTRQPAKG